MLRYRRLERGRNSPSWYGLWADQYGNVYRRVRIWHPGFWLFVMRSPMFDGERWRALKTYIKNRREYLYEESVKRTKGESHRSLLPRMLHAAKVRRQEILLARLEEQVLPLARTRDENYEAFQKRDEALKKAKEKRDPAHGEWQLAMSTVLGAQDRVKRARKDLAELKGGS